MPNFTRKAIKDSMIKLLNERPLNQITVKAIVEDCGINRNTFYYHFADIPTLLLEIVTEEAEKIMQKYPTVESAQQCMDVAIEFAIQNRRAAQHIYHSVNRDLYEHYLMQVCDHVVSRYVEFLSEGKTLEKRDRTVIVRFYRCVCFGLSIDWMNNGMKDDVREDFHRLCEIRSGALEEMIQRCEK